MFLLHNGIMTEALTNVPHRKKYFSSVERLRIVEQSAAEKRKTPLTQSALAKISQRSSSDNAERRSSTLQASNDEMAPFRSHSKSLAAPLGQEPLSESEATWFLGLPGKVKRQQFSPEEQEIWTARSIEALEKATLRAYTERHFHRPVNGEHYGGDTAGDVEYRTLSFAGFAKGEDDSLSKPSTQSTANDFETNVSRLFTHLRSASEQSEDWSSAKPTPHVAALAPPSIQFNPSQKRRQSVQRALKLTPLPMSPPMLAPPATPPMPPSDTASTRTQLSSRLSRPFDGMFLDQHTPPDARHHRDPDTRKQLRQYTRSPHRFDEAVEFGFPVTDNEFSDDQKATSTEASLYQTPFIGIEAAADPDSDGFSDTYSFSTRGPRTPTHDIRSRHTAIKQPSFDSAIGLYRDHEHHYHHQSSQLQPPQPRPPQPVSLSPADSLNKREMTIHMTLTRSDLRDRPLERPASVCPTLSLDRTVGETQLPDLLALEALPVCDDPTGAQGAFAVRSNSVGQGFRKAFKGFLKH